MTLTSTAIGFLSISLGLAFCGARFFGALQRMGGVRAGSKTAVLLPFFLFGFAGVNAILGLGGLFLIQNSELFNTAVIVSHFLLVVTAILGTYIVVYIFLPSVTPWLAAVPAGISGIILIVSAFADASRPFIEESGVINFDLSRITSVFLAYILFFAIGSVFVIFSHLFLAGKSYEVRSISLVLAIAALIGIINAFVRYLLPPDRGVNFLRTGLYDILHMTTGIIFIVVFALSPFILAVINHLRITKR